MDFFDKEYYTSDEVAKLLGVTRRSLRNYLKQGKIVGTKYGGRWNFSKEDIENYIKNENSQLLEEEKDRKDYSLLKKIYFFDTEEEMTEKMNFLVDKFNEYKKTKKCDCKMSCEVKENTKIEFMLISKDFEVIYDFVKRIKL